MQATVFSKEGKDVGSVELSDSVFVIEPHEHAMHMAVKVHLANQRQGTRKTKTRAEVSGGGKKPWKQKGRGTARSGSSRSPVWVGGGAIHGPKVGVHYPEITVKLKKLARRSALSSRVKENSLTIIDDLVFSNSKTSQMISVLKSLNLSRQKTLVVVPDSNENTILSCRNIPNIEVVHVDALSTYGILSHAKLLICRNAIEAVTKSLEN